MSALDVLIIYSDAFYSLACYSFI